MATRGTRIRYTAHYPIAITEAMQTHLNETLATIEQQVQEGKLPDLQEETRHEFQQLLERTVRTCLTLANNQITAPWKRYPHTVTRAMQTQIDAFCLLVEDRHYCLPDPNKQGARDQFSAHMTNLVETCLGIAAESKSKKGREIHGERTTHASVSETI